MKNQSGQGTVLFLSAMPLMLALLCVAAALAITMDGHSSNLLNCRMQLLAAQKKQAQLFNQLFGMNQTALQLHFRYETAKAEVLAAPENPEALATLRAQIAYNLHFHAEQDALMNQIQLAEDASISNFPTQMKQGLRESLPPIASSPNGTLLDVSVRRSRLGVAEIALDSVTSQFKPLPDFSVQQALTARWHFHIPLLLPNWMKQVLGRTPTLSGECSATLGHPLNQMNSNHELNSKQGDTKWIPILSADKS